MINTTQIGLHDWSITSEVDVLIEIDDVHVDVDVLLTKEDLLSMLEAMEATEQVVVLATEGQLELDLEP